MTHLNITQAREKLPKIMDEVYFHSKTFIVTRRGIPMAKISRPNKTGRKQRLASAKDKQKIIEELRGMWKNNWQGINTIEVADMLRERSMIRHVR